VAARRCSVDGISFPDSTAYTTCPVCSQGTSYISNDSPDEDWREKVAALLERLRQAAALQEPTPHLTRPVPFIEEHGRTFVRQTDLINAGLRKALDQSLWLFWDSDCRLWEAQGYDEPRRRWWIEPVPTEVREEDIPRG
jgi:hypothetical protein